MRASPSSLVSSTKPGTSRLCSAPKSRTASQTWAAGAGRGMSLWMEAMVRVLVVVGWTKAHLRRAHHHLHRSWKVGTLTLYPAYEGIDYVHTASTLLPSGSSRNAA